MGAVPNSVLDTAQTESGRLWVESFRTVQAYLGALPCPSATQYTIASNALLLRFGSELLRKQISRAFEPLESGRQPGPQLTVILHDLTTAPLAAPSLQVARPSGGQDAILLVESPDLILILHRKGQWFCAWDRSMDTAYWLVSDAASIPYMERAAPMKLLLCYWLGECGRFLVHGAAVSHGALGGVLILGHGGAGKSTTALICLEAGMGYAGDDHCLVSADPPITAYSLYATAKLAFAELGRFPTSSANVDLEGRPPEEKALMFFNGARTAQLKSGFALRALLLARITSAEKTALRRVGSAEAFRSIAPSCALHPPSQRAAALRCFNGLARQLPCYVLELGSDRTSTPTAIQEVLENSAGSKEGL